MMATHDHHAKLSGYNPSQLLVDGCAECARRGSDPLEALLRLDGTRFLRAWERAAEWQQDRLPPGAQLSSVEAPMLRVLWTVQVMFERFHLAPLGTVPIAMRFNPAIDVEANHASRVMALYRNVSNPASDISGRLTELERDVVLLGLSLLMLAQPDDDEWTGESGG